MSDVLYKWNTRPLEKKIKIKKLENKNFKRKMTKKQEPLLTVNYHALSKMDPGTVSPCGN